MDVRDEQSVSAGVDRALAVLGGVDVLVNNAGIGMRTVNPDFMTDPAGFWHVSPDGFRDLFATNVLGYFLVARAVVPHMLDPAIMGPPVCWLASRASDGITDQRIVATEFDVINPPPTIPSP